MSAADSVDSRAASQSHLRLLPGLLLSLLLGVAAQGIARAARLETWGMGTLTVAILLGIAVGNTMYARIAPACAPGVDFSRQRLLRLGVVLYGFHLTLQDILQVGPGGMLLDVLMMMSTFGLAWLLGTRLFKLDRKTAMLIGIGSSVCGAAAVMAGQPVVRGRAEQVTVAISTVLVFGTIATLLYPVLYRLNLHIGWLPASQAVFGMYTGATVHEVAQVVAAARSVGERAADVAVIVKMVRVMLLAPFLVALSFYLSWERRRAGGTSASARGIVVPWFAVWFFAVMLFHSALPLPRDAVRVIVGADTLLLATAMAALGLATHVSAIRRAGYRPLLLAATLFAWLVGGGAVVGRVVLNGL